MSLKEVALEGLEKDLTIKGLSLKKISRIKGRGVVTSLFIPANTYATEDKYSKIHYLVMKAEEEYDQGVLHSTSSFSWEEDLFRRYTKV